VTPEIEQTVVSPAVAAVVTFSSATELPKYSSTNVLQAKNDTLLPMTGVYTEYLP